MANPFVQKYKYDPLDRITEAKETNNSIDTWIQQFGYDRYGNRTSFNQTIGSTNINTTPAIDADTNRFDDDDFIYDANGNVVGDIDPITSLGRTFTFNGDNKQTEVKRDGVTIGRYYYDGEGRRIKKVTDTETTVFVYAAGQLIAEYSTAISQTPSVSYLTNDHLGSPRIITNEYGQVNSRRDFMPFGEDIYLNVGGRTSGLKYGASEDDVRQKFTGYQKDEETGLDFAEARMYENLSGRFTAVDPLLASGKSTDPQTFNRYIYVSNNPLKYEDPSGMLRQSPDIIIIENGPTEGDATDSSDSTKNPIGHTAIGITWKGVYSMGNADEEPERDKKNNILGGSVEDYLEREAPRRDTVITIIKTTPEQDAAIAAKLEEIAGSRDKITEKTILTDNCSIRVNEALDAAKIPSGGVRISPGEPLDRGQEIGRLNPVIPGSAGQRARAVPGAQVYKIEKGSALTAEIKKIIVQFEKP